MIKNLLLVGLGGAAGCMLRYVGQLLLNTPNFPFGTFFINLAGCFIIGVLWGLMGKNMVNDAARLLLMTGFCGGFTTFSAFTLESIQMLNNNKLSYFFIYTSSSVAGGLLATFLGFKLLN